MRRSISIGVVLVLACSGCFGRGKRFDANVLEVTRRTGNASVRAPGAEEWSPLRPGSRVVAGAAVRVEPGGEVAFARGEDSSIEVRAPGGEAATLTVGGTAGDVQVESGDVLVQSASEAPITVRAQGTTARATDAVFRLDRRLRMRVGSYRGAVDVALEDDELPALTSLDEWLVNPRIAPVRQPYSLDLTDAWDRRMLPGAVQIEEALQPLAAGYEARFGARTRSLTELAALARDSGRDLRFAASSLSRTSSADVLIGVVYSLMLESVKKGTAARLLPVLLDRRKQGAAWGVIAHERGLVASDVLNSVTCAISLRTGEARPGERCFVPLSTRPTPSVDSSPSRTQRPATQRPRSNRPRPRPTSSPSPTRTSSPKPTRSPSPSPSPSPTPTCNPVDELLGNC